MKNNTKERTSREGLGEALKDLLVPGNIAKKVSSNVEDSYLARRFVFNRITSPLRNCGG